MNSNELEHEKTFSPQVCIFDVDGVLTDGKFYYSEQGKLLKRFGPDDNDGLSILEKFVEVRFVTGDRKGFEISRKRIVEDMGYRLDLVSTVDRIDWIKEKYMAKNVLYMGDGIFDHFVMQEVGYSIAPHDGHRHSVEHADFVTTRRGGDRAVAEACLHIIMKFFSQSYFKDLVANRNPGSQEWIV